MVGELTILEHTNEPKRNCLAHFTCFVYVCDSVVRRKVLFLLRLRVSITNIVDRANHTRVRVPFRSLHVERFRSQVVRTDLSNYEPQWEPFMIISWYIFSS